MILFSNLRIWDSFQKDFQLKEISVKDSRNLFKGKSKELDCSEFLGIPLGIDLHVHFREPGYEHKEDMITGANAAITGGTATVLDMSNNNPITDSIEALKQKRELSKKQNLVNVLITTPISNRTIDKLKKLDSYCDAYKIYLPETSGDLVLNQDELPPVFAKLEEIETSNPIIIQAEDSEAMENYKEESTHERRRPVEVEASAIQKIIGWAKDFKFLKFHVTLVSSSMSLKMLELANTRNLTTDTCPRYLYFDQESDLPEYSKKVNPPYRSSMDKSQLKKALAIGIIDMVCSDHSPHTLEEKKNHNPSGLPGVQELIPSIVNLVQRGEIEWERAVEAFHEFPAQILNQQNMKIEDGNFILIDVNTPFEITKEWLKTKTKWSAFEGQFMQGKPQIIVKNNELIASMI